MVRHGKGDKDRVVPLTAARVAELHHYLEAVRPALAHLDSPPRVWLAQTGRPLAPGTVRDRLRYYARLAGFGLLRVRSGNSWGSLRRRVFNELARNIRRRP